MKTNDEPMRIPDPIASNITTLYSPFISQVRSVAWEGLHAVSVRDAFGARRCRGWLRRRHEALENVGVVK